MDDSVVVSDERLSVRKRPAGLDDDGSDGVELVVTALVDAKVTFHVFEALPEAVDLEEVRLLREPDGGQWWRDAERHGLVLQGSVAPGKESVARWTVRSAAVPSGGALLRPPEIDSSARTVEVGAHLDEIGETIRRLESSFDRPPGGARADGAETGPSDAASGPGETEDGGTLVEDLVEEIENGRVGERQLATLRDHLGPAGAHRSSDLDDGGERPDGEPVADPVVSVLGDAESGAGDLDTPQEEPTNGEDDPSGDGPGQSARLPTVLSRLQELERRVERLESTVDEREAARDRQADRIDALEDELVEAVRGLQEDVEDVRERRRRMADALRRPGETPATD